MAEVNLKVSADIQGIKTKLEELTKSVAEVQSKMGTSFKAAAEMSEKAMVDASNTITTTMVNNTTKVISSLEKEEDQLKALQMMMKQSTNPDAQKSLQKEIDATNARIKSLGGSMQKFRDISVMSLGEMKKYMRELRGISLVGMTPEQINNVNTQMALLKDKMADYSKMLSTTGDKTQMLIGAMQGFVGIAQGVTGTLSLMGIENKNLEKSMMALINLSQMMSTFHQLEESGILAKMGATIKDTAAKYLNITATRAQAISQKAATASTQAGAVGFKVLGAAMKSVPIIALVAGLAAVGGAIYEMVRAAKDSTSQYNIMKKVSKELSTTYAQEAAQLKLAGKAVMDAKFGTQERVNAVKQLNDQYKDYLPYMLTERMSNEQISAALDKVNNSLRENFLIKMKSQDLEDVYKKQVEMDLKILDQEAKIQSTLAYEQDLRNRGQSKMAVDVGYNARRQKDTLEDLKAQRKDLDAEVAKVEAVYDKIFLKYNTADTQIKKMLKPDTPITADVTQTKIDLVSLTDLYGAYYAELIRYNETIANINKAWKTKQIKTQKEYNERVKLEQENHYKIMIDLEESYVDDLDENMRWWTNIELERYNNEISGLRKQLAEKEITHDEFNAKILKADAYHWKNRMDMDEVNRINKAVADANGAVDEETILKNNLERQQKIEEGWFVQEIYRREENLTKRLKLLRDFYAKGLILKADFDKAENETEQAIWTKRIDIAKQMAGKLYNVYKQGIDNQIKALDDLINQREQRIGEIQSLLEAEIQLNKDGFASNIQMYQTQLEQEQKLRDEALERQAKYNKQKSIMEAFEQSMDIGTAIASILKDAAVKTGLVAPISGAVAIAAFLALWAKAKSQATVKYEHGGRGVFEGASHSQGGIPFGNNMEAQGGEAYYILNKSATNSKGRKLMDVLFDAVNGGRVNFDAPLALADTPISVEMKEQREIKEIWKHLKGQKSTVYGADYRIETFGNVKRKIKI